MIDYTATSDSGIILLHRHRGEFVCYLGTHWERQSTEQIDAFIRKFLARVVVGRQGEGRGGVVHTPILADELLVLEIRLALPSVRNVLLDDQIEMPCWLPGTGGQSGPDLQTVLFIVQETPIPHNCAAPPEQSLSVQPRLDTSRLRIQVRGRWHDVTEEQKRVLAILFEAKGAWVSGKTIGGRPDKARRSMPMAVAALIESDRPKGYRIPSLLP